MSKDGTTYVSLYNSNLLKITSSGKQLIIAGGDSAAVKLYEPASAVLSADERVVYISTGDTTLNGTIEGGQVVVVKLWEFIVYRARGS